MLFTDPLAFEEFLSPIAGGVKIRPMVGSRFRGNIEIQRLQKVGLFTLGTDSFLEGLKVLEEFVPYHLGRVPKSLKVLRQIRPDCT